MTNYIEYKDKVAFHPGYYINEIIEDSGFSQKDFSKRLDITYKDLSLIIKGEHSLSPEMAAKLSRLLGTSIKYWTNIQSTYDTLAAEFESEKIFDQEKEIFKVLGGYTYFQKNCNLQDTDCNIKEQIRILREYLKISSLTILKQKNFAVSFRSDNIEASELATIKANAMVQIAINKSIAIKMPKFNLKKFKIAIEKILLLTESTEKIYSTIQEEFKEAGVAFIVLPNLSGSRTNGATKKIDDRIMLMVTDRRKDYASFWFTLLHEVGHIINNDYGISLDGDKGESERKADKYAEDKLIDPKLYLDFIENKNFDKKSIINFANIIKRDPSIVFGRLQKDGFVKYNSIYTKLLRRTFVDTI